MALQEVLFDQEVMQKSHLDTLNELEEAQGEELQQLLHRYRDVFQEPQGIPPKREIEHAIILKPGISPINVRPYKYAYHHKDEIERQVSELLKARAIK